jgi:4-aminobutyrate aminotransferase-like enzyme
MSAAIGRETSPQNDNVVDLESRYLLQNYARHPLVLVRGDGPYMWDAAGKRYLDFIAGIGVNALGQNHPRIVRVIEEQAARLIHTSNLFYNEYQGPLAKRIAEVSGLNRTFFTNSGTESSEGALKMMKAHGHDRSPEKFEIVSLENSFHGRTIGALSVTGQAKYRKDFEPLIRSRRKRTHRRNFYRVDSGRGRRAAPRYSVLPARARAGRPARCPALLRRDSGTHRQILRLSTGRSACDARYRDCREAHRLRHSPRHHYGQ